MNDVIMVEPKTRTFSDLVKEAFIDTIRSVLIIDDQYPTWEQIFSEGGYDSSNKKWANKASILKVIQQFRKVSPALTVDIHDGKHNEEIGSYLHQSDLLVLDYQLEESEPHGVRATAIIADLLKNNHFNLVVVHTAIGDLIDPFNMMLMTLLTPIGISDDKVAAGLKLVEDFEDSANNDLNDVLNDLKTALNETAYIALRYNLNDGVKPYGFLMNAPEIEAFRVIADKAKWDVNARLKVLDWGMSVHDQRVAAHKALPRDLRWSAPGDGKQPWIRTNGGFIAFADKRNTELLDILQSAIEDWRPSPSRLMSSRIRAEISLQGAGAEDSALSDKHAYWQYYQELRSTPLDAQAAKNHRKTLLEGHTARHTERLLDLIGMNAVAFGLRVLEADPTETDATAPGFAEHYAVKSDEREKALSHYNAHISTKPVSGWHLHPGHIFKIDQEMWVCLSPSCDLVPMQKTTTAVRDSKAAEVKPFVAVRLTLRNELSRSEVNSNTLIFLKEGKDIKKYSIYSDGVDLDEGKSRSPVWRLFMASNYGKFDINDDRTADLNLSYLCGRGQSMHVESTKACIVGQLRYEYALNLIQKLGVEFTRIGLDFSAPAS